MSHKAIRKNSEKGNAGRSLLTGWLRAKPFLFVCALLVVAGVVWRCMVPAVTEDNDTTVTDRIGTSIPYTEAPAGAHLFQPDVIQVSFEQKAMDVGTSTASVKFDLSYTISNSTLEQTSYIYYNLNTDRTDKTGATISVPEGGLPEGGVLGDVVMGGNKVGTYRIEEDGLVVICFSEEFIQDRLAASDDSRTGTLSFTADVTAAADNTEDDITLEFGGQASTNTSVTLTGFQYTNVSVEKSVPSGKVNDDRTIEWKVVVKNPDEVDLKGLIITDSQFKNAIRDFQGTDNGTYDKVNDQYIMGSASEGYSEIEITYVTAISDTDYNLLLNGGTIKNDVQLKKADGTLLKEANASVNYEPIISAEKSGTVTYGADTDTITWTITIENPKGLNLDGWSLKDDQLATADAGSICVQGTGGYGIIGNNTLVFSSTNEKEIVVTFIRTVDKTTATSSDYSNSATLCPPDNSTTKYLNSSVTQYPFSVSKSGKAVQGQQKNTWTISIWDSNTTDAYTCAGMVITDDVMNAYLTGLSEGEREQAVTISVYTNSGTKTIPYTVLLKDGSVDGIQLSNDFDYSSIASNQTISVVYQTDATDTSQRWVTQDADGNFVTTNTATIGVGGYYTSTPVTSTVTYQMRSEVTKTLTSQATLSDDGTTLTAAWSVEVGGEEGSFKSFRLTDIMSASSGDLNLDHTFESIKSVTVQLVDGSSKTLTTDQYQISKTDTGFVCTLNVDEDTLSKINSLTLTYESTINIDSDKLQAGDVIVYKNTAAALDKTSSADGQYTVIDQDGSLKKYSGYDSGSIDSSKLETATVNIGGVDTPCYLFRWVLDINENGAYDDNQDQLVLTDTLPEGFRLYDTLSVSQGYKVHTYSTWEQDIDINSSDSPIAVSTSINEDGTQEITFQTKWWDYDWAHYRMKVYYVTYVPQTVFNEQLANGSYTVKNTVSDGEKTIAAEVEVTEPVKEPTDNTITKTASQATGIGGYITYTVDFNPEALDLADGSDWVVLQDYLDFGDSYYAINSDNTKGNLVQKSPSDLLHTSLVSITFKEVQEDGTLKALDEQPTYVFEDDPKTTETVDCGYQKISSLYGAGDYDGFRFDDIPEGAELNIVFQADDTFSKDKIRAIYSLKQQGDWTGYTTHDYQLTKIADNTYQLTIYVSYDGTSASSYNGKGNVYVDINKDQINIQSASYTLDSKLGDASLTMTVPDQKHLVIEYQYKAYSDQIYSIPNVSNTISTVGSTNNHTNTCWSDYEVHNDSSATVKTGLEIVKVDASNTGILLQAGFELARYNTDKHAWEYATVLKTTSGIAEITEWSTTEPGSAIITTTTDSKNPITVSLNSKYLYYLKEVHTPTGYDTSYSDNQYFVYNNTLSTGMLPYNKLGPDNDYIITKAISTVTEGSTMQIKNRKAINITAAKTWSDGAAKHVQDAVQFQLYTSNTFVASAATIPEDAVSVQDAVTINAETNWSYIWSDLPSVDDNGTILYYYVKEVSTPEGYSTTYNGNGINQTGTITVINTSTQEEPDTVEVTVNKQWENYEPKAETSIELQLYRRTASDTTQMTVGETVTLTAENSWTYTWTDLPAKDDSGHSYIYSVAEQAVKEGDTDITSQFTVTYSDAVSTEQATDGTITLEVTNTKQEEPNPSYELPETGGPGSKRYLWTGLALMALAGLGYIAAKKQLFGKISWCQKTIK
jgi:hypothetical protein